MQEAGVRLDARELLAFEVEDFDGVVAGAAIQSLATGSKVKWGVRKGGGAYTANTGRCSCVLAVRIVWPVVLIVRKGLSIRISQSLTLPLRLADKSSR